MNRPQFPLWIVKIVKICLIFLTMFKFSLAKFFWIRLPVWDIVRLNYTRVSEITHISFIIRLKATYFHFLAVSSPNVAIILA